MAGNHDVPTHSTYCHTMSSTHSIEKLFYVTTGDIESWSCWHSVYLSVSFKPREKKTFSLSEVCCAMFLTLDGGVRCDISSSFRTLPCCYLDMICPHFTHCYQGKRTLFIYSSPSRVNVCCQQVCVCLHDAWPFIKLIFLKSRIGWDCNCNLRAF